MIDKVYKRKNLEMAWEKSSAGISETLNLRESCLREMCTGSLDGGPRPARPRASSDLRAIRSAPSFARVGDQRFEATPSPPAVAFHFAVNAKRVCVPRVILFTTHSMRRRFVRELNSFQPTLSLSRGFDKSSVDAHW
jgi:hypothetical protein